MDDFKKAGSKMSSFWDWNCWGSVLKYRNRGNDRKILRRVSRHRLKRDLGKEDGL